VTGRVTLVGAGPGDPELLTLKAVRAIARADVILIDDLVNREVLAHAAAGVRVIPVGKRGGCRSTPQAFIERLMVAEARAGHCVVRLKGGDPFLFGRGGEEVDHLRQAGVEVEVVPGITSGLAAPTCAGVSVTHRDVSPGVVFVTGHEKDATRQRVDWTLLARSGFTLVIYMGVANCERLQQQLLAGGLAAGTPALAVQDATLPTQRILRTRLGALAQDIAAHGIVSPAVLVIGEAAATGAVALEPALRAEFDRVREGSAVGAR
jgi:uroporphyrin-III C-methyltransferase